MELPFSSDLHRDHVDFELVYRRVKCPRGILPQLPEGSRFLFDKPITFSVTGVVSDPDGATLELRGQFAPEVMQNHADFLTWIEVFEKRMNDAPIHLGKEDYFVADNRSFQIL